VVLNPVGGSATFWTYGPGHSIFIASSGVTGFDLNNGKAQPMNLKWPHPEGYSNVRISPDGRLAALTYDPPNEAVKDWMRHSLTLRNSQAAGYEGVQILILDYASGQERARIKSSSAVRKMEFSADSRYLAALGSDDTIRVWDISSMQEVARTRSTGVLDIAFTADDKLAVVDPHHFTLEPLRPEDLIRDLCHTRLTRNLRREEWQRYAPAETFARVCSELEDGAAPAK
jgi:WD40 repeat protein